MKTTLIAIAAIYWVLCLALLYIIRRGADDTDKESIWLHLVVVLFCPIIVPFILPRILPGMIRKYKYKNRPAPIDKKDHKWSKCYEVEDANERFGIMTIWEYNRKHSTNFGLDDVYGKGYTDSLSQDEKDICELKSRMADIEEGTPNNEYATLCKEFIKARYDNSFRHFANKYLSDDIAFIIYNRQTINGKEDFCRYWEEWMQRLKRNDIALNSKIKQGNYVGHPIIEDKISGYRSMYLTFVVKEGMITHAVFQPKEEWLDKLPLSYKPLSFHQDISLDPQESRMPCPVCGTLSESLEWKCAMYTCGGDENDADVSMCPYCHRIVEVEMEHENEDLDMYCGETVDDTPLRIYGNEFSKKGREFHQYLHDISDIEEPLGESFTDDVRDIFPELSFDGELSIHFAEQTGTGDVSCFHIKADMEANRQNDAIDILLSHIRCANTANAAWAIYLICNADAVLPVFWHGAYKCRKYVFSAREANDIEPFRNGDTSIIEHFNDVLPSVTMLTNSKAEVKCCYWNDWKGLVRETSIVDFINNKCEVVESATIYKYECDIIF